MVSMIDWRQRLVRLGDAVDERAALAILIHGRRPEAALPIVVLAVASAENAPLHGECLAFVLRRNFASAAEGILADLSPDESSLALCSAARIVCTNGPRAAVEWCLNKSKSLPSDCIVSLLVRGEMTLAEQSLQKHPSPGSTCRYALRLALDGDAGLRAVTWLIERVEAGTVYSAIDLELFCRTCTKGDAALVALLGSYCPRYIKVANTMYAAVSANNVGAARALLRLGAARHTVSPTDLIVALRERAPRWTDTTEVLASRRMLRLLRAHGLLSCDILFGLFEYAKAVAYNKGIWRELFKEFARLEPRDKHRFYRNLIFWAAESADSYMMQRALRGGSEENLARTDLALFYLFNQRTGTLPSSAMRSALCCEDLLHVYRATYTIWCRTERAETVREHTRLAIERFGPPARTAPVLRFVLPLRHAAALRLSVTYAHH